ncbi:ArsR/SmtB family transcription factor [Cellulomonas citrea]|uniref:ArsR/SmtB family transcription factor n=1 Tax=Cellulomonas citrea TaxID=1909423 RepID=UPI001F425DC5|nr:metalloregulator ArsR/SmtB family transcription factor [Cellulomonas citrea]
MAESIRIESSPADRSARVDASLALLTAVADPVRWTVLDLLRDGTHCVCDLQAHVPVAANLLSYHLKVLRDVGLVTTARRGRWVDYTLAPDAQDRLCAALPTGTTRVTATARSTADARSTTGTAVGPARSAR